MTNPPCTFTLNFLQKIHSRPLKSPQMNCLQQVSCVKEMSSVLLYRTGGECIARLTSALWELKVQILNTKGGCFLKLKEIDILWISGTRGLPTWYQNVLRTLCVCPLCKRSSERRFTTRLKPPLCTIDKRRISRSCMNPAFCENVKNNKTNY